MPLPQLCSVHDSQGMKDIKSKLDFGFTWKRLHETRILLPVVLCCPLSQARCSILYLKPCVQIVLWQKVNTQLIAKSLDNVEYDFYKPRFIISFWPPLGTLLPQQPQHTGGFQTNLTAGLRSVWSDP